MVELPGSTRRRGIRVEAAEKVYDLTCGLCSFTAETVYASVFVFHCEVLGRQLFMTSKGQHLTTNTLIVADGARLLRK